MNAPNLTRQQIRALQRRGTKLFVNQNYGKEPRHERRAVAHMLAKRKVRNARPDDAGV